MRRIYVTAIVSALFIGLLQPAAVASPGLVAAYVTPADWADVSNTVYGTGIRNFFGLRSRTATTALPGMFVFDQTVASSVQPQISIWESTIEGKKVKISGPSKSGFTRIQKGDRTGLKFLTPKLKVHGDRNYIAVLELRDGTSSQGKYETSFSLEYSMSVGCALPSLLSMTVRDTSKGFLSLVSLVSTTLQATVEKVIPKKLSAAKRAQLLAVIRKANVAGLAADEGLKLIDIAEVYANGEDVAVELVVQKTEEVLSKNFKTVEVTLTAEQALELAKLLSEQGGLNADKVSKACNVGQLVPPVPTTPTVTPSATAKPNGTAVIEKWFGKGWTGDVATCAQILPIAQGAPASLDISFGEPRVMAINAAAKAMWYYSVSGSGDPLIGYVGPQSVQGGLWGPGTQQFDEIIKLLKGSGDHWTQWALKKSAGKVTCVSWK